MNPILEVVLVCVLLGVLPALVGILPRFIKSKKYPHTFAFLGCISAGVFLSLLLGDMIPELFEKKPDISATDRFFTLAPHDHSHFNYSLFLSGVVFLVFLVVDGVIGHAMLGDHDHEHCHSHSHCHDEKTDVSSSVSLARAFAFVGIVSLHSALEGFRDITFKTSFFHLLIHKLLEVFAIGTALMRVNLRLVSYCLLILFSSALTPAAHAIYYSMTSKNLLNELFLSVMGGLSLGAVVFATFGECIPHEIGAQYPSIAYRIGYISIGYLAASLISMF